MDEKLFTKGFNYGYDLQEQKPELLNILLKGISTGHPDLIEGLKEGQKQRQKEVELERIRQSIDRSNGRGKSNERDLER